MIKYIQWPLNMPGRLSHNFPEIIPDAEILHEVIAVENTSGLTYEYQNWFDIPSQME